MRRRVASPRGVTGMSEPTCFVADRLVATDRPFSFGLRVAAIVRFVFFAFFALWRCLGASPRILTVSPDYAILPQGYDDGYDT
jgi:hypothetical protein